MSGTVLLTGVEGPAASGTDARLWAGVRRVSVLGRLADDGLRRQEVDAWLVLDHALDSSILSEVEGSGVRGAVFRVARTAAAGRCRRSWRWVLARRRGGPRGRRSARWRPWAKATRLWMAVLHLPSPAKGDGATNCPRKSVRHFRSCLALLR